MRHTFFALFFLAPFLAGLASCVAAAAGVGAGVFISQEGIDNSTYIIQLPHDVKVTWSATKTTLSASSPKPIDTQEEARIATADVDGAKVRVTVEAFDLNKSLVKVSARKYGVSNGEIAKMVTDRIVSALDR